MDLTYFNPNSQKEADFLVGFVARQSTLEFLVKQLSLVQTGQAARHHLIIAPRGFGKTSLLRRIAIEARSNAGLHARFIPLRFREEQHNVISLDVFWRNCLQSLLEAREDEGAAQDELDTLEADWEAHAPRHSLPREAQDGESAWQTLQMRCAALQRRPVLLIDNLDTLLAGLSEQHQWSLRRRLQAADGPVIIAAASRYPDSTHDTNAAFFEFFRIQTLDKLSDKEVFTCLQHIAEHRGKAGEPVRNMLQQDPGRVAALNTLAGGNPRTLSVLYGVLESHMSGDILSQLSAMLDTFTGWYQARTEELPMQARAVFDALALHWDPMTAATLAQATGLDTPAVSSQLSRLEKSGYVETVSLSRNKKGRSGYQVSERFFNIWYLMRNGPRRAKQRIRFLTTFIQSCFSNTERQTLAQAALQDLRAAPEYALALASSLKNKSLRGALLDHAKNRSSEVAQDGEFHPLVEELRAEWGLGSKSDADAGRALFNKAIELSSRGQSAEEIAVYDEIIKRFGRAPEFVLRELVLRAMVNKAYRLGKLERSDEAIAVHDEINKRFGGAPEFVIRELVARAMVNKGYRLGKLERTEEAIAVYDEIIVSFGDASELGLREPVARAMMNKGNWLAKLERAEEASAVYDEIIKRFEGAPELVLRELVAKAMVNMGNGLWKLERPEEAIAVYDEIIVRFDDASELGLREPVARAMVNKGNALGKLERAEEAIAVYDEIIVRFGDASELGLRQAVVIAMVNKGYELGILERSEEAIAVYDAVIARFGDAAERGLYEPVAKAMVMKGNRLGLLDRSEENIAVYDEIIKRFGHASELELREQVAIAMVNKGNGLGELERAEEAIAVYDAVIARFGDAAERGLREPVAWAMINKGNGLGKLERFEEAITVFNQVVERFNQAKEPVLREAVASALIFSGYLLLEKNQLDASESAYRACIERQPNWGGAYNSLGNLLYDFKGDINGARKAYEEGLPVALNEPALLSILHGNLAYLLALHIGDALAAQEHVARAVEIEGGMPPAGASLLEALLAFAGNAWEWPKVYAAIDKAVASGDNSLWSNYADDLERLLWFIVAKGKGAEFKEWMARANYPTQYAPMFHAFVAALEGEDHLLQINPETRQPASKIYSGIARRLALYERDGSKARKVF